jgi:hypothetical protein
MSLLPVLAEIIYVFEPFMRLEAKVRKSDLIGIIGETDVLRGYRQRVSAEEPHELQRHPAPLRATLLAAFCRIGAKAEQRVERELIEDLKRVSGKNGLLFQLAEAALARPDGILRESRLPSSGRANVERSCEGMEGHGAGLSAATPGRDAQLVSFPLPPDVARAAGHTPVPFQQ